MSDNFWVGSWVGPMQFSSRKSKCGGAVEESSTVVREEHVADTVVASACCGTRCWTRPFVALRINLSLCYITQQNVSFHFISFNFISFHNRAFAFCLLPFASCLFTFLPFSLFTCLPFYLFTFLTCLLICYLFKTFFTFLFFLKKNNFSKPFLTFLKNFKPF